MKAGTVICWWSILSCLSRCCCRSFFASASFDTPLIAIGIADAIIGNGLILYNKSVNYIEKEQLQMVTAQKEISFIIHWLTPIGIG
ncbi:MAG: hypothetical protein NC240_07975 [Clostridium sp.]|nr:hypothetical protein [Clostridium sp.]